MLVTCNDVAALHASLYFPLVGAWRARLDLDADAIAPGPATIAAGGATLTGTVWRVGAYRGVAYALVVGGAGKLGATLRARAYRTPSVRHVIVDILRDAGETLSATSDTTTLDTRLDAWSRMPGTAAEALDAITEEIGSSWSVLDDGTIFVGQPSWSAIDVGDGVAIDESGANARSTYGIETLVLRPGGTLDSAQISAVQYVVTSGTTRAEVEFVRRTPITSVGDRLRGALTKIVAHLTRRTAYHATYGASVVSQNGDGTLELKADTKLIALPSRVPIRGLPGVSVEVLPGAHVLVSFENGSPTSPRATLFDPSSLKSITINSATKIVANAPLVELGDGAQMGIARGGDVVQVVLDALSAGQIIAPSSGGPCTLAPSAADGLVLPGQILTSSDEVSAA